MSISRRMSPMFRSRATAYGFLTACLCVFIAGESCADDAKLRAWKDSTGQHELEAAFVSLKGTTVTLRQKDGSAFEIDITKLSLADQAVARAMAKAADSSPFKKKSTSPFQPSGTPSQPMPADANPGGLSAKPPLTRPVWSNAKTVSPLPSQDDWSFEPDPLPAEQALGAKSIALPPHRDFFEKGQGFVVNSVCQRAVLGFTLERPGRGDDTSTRLELIDLEAGRVLSSGTVPGTFRPLALSDDGERLLVRKNVFGFGKSDAVELWAITPNGISRLVHWIPYDDAQGAARDVTWAEFLDDQRVLTMAGGGRLVAWNATSAEPIYKLETGHGITPVLTPGRKYAVYATKEALGLLDPNAGDVLATVSTETLNHAQLIVSPDGTRFGAVDTSKIHIWDFATGQHQREILATGKGSGTSVWMEGNFVLAGGNMLFDVEHRLPVWTYNGAGSVQAAGGLGWFSVGSHRGPGALLGVPIPHQAAREKLQTALKDPNLFALQPGTPVKIDVSGISDAAEREKAKASLSKRVVESGCRVADGASVTLKGWTETGERREMTYRTFGSFGTESHKVQEYFSKVAYLSNGTTLWSTQSSSVPHFLQTKENESIRQALKRHERPNYRLFETIELPTHLLKPSEGGSTSLGTSQVTARGVQ